MHPPPEDVKQSGFRFGAQPYSRMEFATGRGRHRKSFEFGLEFKTSEPDGIIFYALGEPEHKHYAALLLQDGYVST